jgi:hypothetical protein
MIYVLLLLIIFLLFCNYDKSNNEYINETKKYTLCIMTIFKNEENYMQEWLDYHIDQGIDHFYLYCNDDNLSKYKYLNDDKYKKYITLIDWVNVKHNENNTIQKQAYHHCIKNYSKKYHFIMMLDLDEFLVNKNKKKVINFINNLKDKWNNIKAFKIQRYDFGSNSHYKKPDGKVMDNYTKREKICSSYKTIANSDYIDKNKPFYGVHDFNFKEKNGKVFNDYFFYQPGPNKCKKNDINEIPLVMNHYYTKSYQEYIDRCKLWENGGINPVGYRKNCEKIFKERDTNEIEDK